MKNKAIGAIFIIIGIVGISVFIAIHSESVSNESNIHVSNYELFLSKANINKQFIHINQYENDMKYVLFQNLNDNIVNIMLYDNDRCQISYHSNDGNSNLGYYKIDDSNLVVYDYEQKQIESYEITDNGIKVNYNGYVFVVNPS